MVLGKQIPNVELSYAGRPVAKLGGARGDVCPRAKHFGGAKLRSECYVIITKDQPMLIITIYKMVKANVCFPVGKFHQDHQGSLSQ